MHPHFDSPLYCEKKMTLPHYDYIFVSPHLDDGVLSCSGTMCFLQEQGYNVLVITVFAGDPLPPFSPLAESFHQLWEVSDEPPYARRKQEERQAMAVLDSEYAWIAWLEVLYRTPHLSREEEICDPTAHPQDEGIFPMLCDWFTDLSCAFPSAQIAIPLGVGSHRDHRVVCQAARNTVDHRSLIFYEDFPYIAFHEQEVLPLAHSYGLGSCYIDIAPFLEQRIQATLRYQSQLAMLCHPPQHIEESIRHYTKQAGEGGLTYSERVWVKSSAQLPLSLQSTTAFKGS